MPEATVLYSVTAVVIAGLILWVAVVLKTAKEPWTREAPRGVAELGPESDEPASAAEGQAEAAEVLANVKKPGGAEIDADATARATPVALGEARARAAEEKAVAEGNADENKADA